MVGLLVKLTILFGVVFGVAYALTKSLRSKEHGEMTKELREAQQRFLELKAALEEGRLTKEEERLLSEWSEDVSAEMPEALKDAGKPHGAQEGE